MIKGVHTLVFLCGVICASADWTSTVAEGRRQPCSSDGHCVGGPGPRTGETCVCMDNICGYRVSFRFNAGHMDFMCAYDNVVSNPESKAVCSSDYDCSHQGTHHPCWQYVGVPGLTQQHKCMNRVCHRRVYRMIEGPGDIPWEVCTT